MFVGMRELLSRQFAISSKFLLFVLMCKDIATSKRLIVQTSISLYKYFVSDSQNPFDSLFYIHYSLF